eukprot:2228864-Pyramimonas_sp.AAC.1
MAQDGSRGPQEIVKTSREAQEAPQEVPKRPTSLFCFWSFLKDFGVRCFSAFRRPNTTQEAPKIASTAPKRPPRWPQDCPGRPHEGPKRAQNDPRGLPNAQYGP